MGAFEGLMFGLQIALQPENLLAAAVGVLVGSIVGLIPGVGPTTGAAILFPITFAMSPTAGLILLAGIYYGVMYGGSTSAVLLNIPGESVSIVAAFEGYPMAQRGRAGPALSIIAFGSFIAGTMAVLLVTILSLRVARFGLLFGPAEQFAMATAGLILLARMMGGSWESGLLPMFVGLALGTVGVDVASGIYRFTYGTVELTRGVPIGPIAIGLFGISEVLRMGERIGAYSRPASVRFLDLMPKWADLRRSYGPWTRGGLLGFFFGLLPGPSATVATFTSYRLEKSISKNKEEFGKGAVEGLAGPEAANNAAATSGLIPILALGLPFTATLAFMLAALVTHGIDPGPRIVDRHPEIFWGVIASMYVGNLMLLIINVPMIGIWVRLLRVRTEYLIPIIIVASMYGSFATSLRLTDVIFLVIIGLIGYAFVIYGYQLAPLIVGVLLGPMIEPAFIQAMVIGRGDPLVLFSSALSQVIWGGALLLIMAVGVGRMVKQRRRTNS